MENKQSSQEFINVLDKNAVKTRSQVTGQVTGYRPQVTGQVTGHRPQVRSQVTQKTIGHWKKLFWTDVLLYKNKISQGTLIIFLSFEQY